MDRLAAEVVARGMTIFARIDHAAGAASVDMALRPTEVLIFGAPKGGTPLMQAEQMVGIDLPLKILVHEDAADAVWLSYFTPEALAARHGLGQSTGPAVAAMAAGLDAIAKKVTGSP
jgi:uncharacterized protein (DUF302 family)